MPSLQFFPQSGGIALVSGGIYSGTPYDLRPAPSPFGTLGGLQFKVAQSGTGPLYICLPPLSGNLGTGNFSGGEPTFNSGGSLTSGGLTDGMELFPGQDYFVPRSRLTSGLSTVRVQGPGTSSGTRLFWEAL